MREAIKNTLKSAVRRFGFDVVKYRPASSDGTEPGELRPEFRSSALASEAIQKLIDGYDFESVLDIGSGEGHQSEIFKAHGKKVTAIDYGKSIYFEKNQSRFEVIIGDFLDYSFGRQFDCVWASHVLEHQVNAGLFLSKIFEITREGGVVCITVPPLQHEILGGHVSLWNGGLLLYNLVLAGFDCREARILSHGYNISVIVRKRSASLPELAYDNGDVDRIAAFLPAGLHEGFFGNIGALNW